MPEYFAAFVARIATRFTVADVHNFSLISWKRYSNYFWTAFIPCADVSCVGTSAHTMPFSSTTQMLLDDGLTHDWRQQKTNLSGNVIDRWKQMDSRDIWLSTAADDINSSSTYCSCATKDWSRQVFQKTTASIRCAGLWCHRLSATEDCHVHS